MRLTFTIDFERRRPEQEQAEYAPQVDVKGSHVLDRADSDDFEQASMVGFCRNVEGAK